MAITVSGTTITFNDGTTQTTAGGAPTTAQVLSATAGASAGAVGTYGLLYKFTGGAISAGSTYAGSGLNFTSAYGTGGSVVSGTWRAMGNTSTGCEAPRYVTLFLRIS